MITNGVLLGLIIYMILKHLVADFLIQNRFPYMWKNKGTYGHMGGILHAFSNIFLTVPLAIYFGNWIPLLVELVTHYHIDWAKRNFNKKHNLMCNTSAQFWDTLGVDQTLHYLIYVWMLAYWIL